MSMSEFDRRQQGSEDDLSPLWTQEPGFPEDFSAEDIAFAQELEGLFAFEQEEIPPFFVQTLLEPDDPRYQVVDDKFEQKTQARVFRELRLQRRLFRSHKSSFHSVWSVLPVRRPMMAFAAALLLFMLATMVVTGNAFASGVMFLLSGNHSGVVQVRSYPSSLSTPSSAPRQSINKQQKQQKTRMNILEAQKELHFPLYWPISMPSNYSLNGAYLYKSDSSNWADGPVMELDFDYALPGVTPHGTGRITICQFKPQGKVFQVVQLGAAHQMEIDSQGHAQAIFVNGQWSRIDKSSYGWAYGGRSELIYERDNVIFWIVGDQRDGIDENVLRNIASSLAIFDFTHFMRIANHVDEVTLSDDTTWMFAGEVVYLDNSADAPSLRIAGDGSDPSHTDDSAPHRGGTHSP